MGAEPLDVGPAGHDYTAGSDQALLYDDSLTDEQRALLRRYADGAIVFLAGPANVAIQLALRPVGRGVVESTVHSGSVYQHPFKRFRTTVGYLDVALWGDDELRRDYREAVNTAHRQVRSGPDSPVKYNAFNRDLQLWVASCLYYGFRDAVTRAHGPLADHEEELLLQVAQRLGTTLQVPADRWHQDRASFEAYWVEGMANLEIDDETRTYLVGVIKGDILPAPLDRLAQPVMQFFNVGFLPPEVRAALGFTWSDRQEAAFARILRTYGLLSRPLPPAVRRVPVNWVGTNIKVRRRLGTRLV